MPTLQELCPGFGSGQYLKSSELPPGGLYATIAGVTVADLQEPDGVRQKPIVQFVGQQQGLVLNVTNYRMLDHLFGRDVNGWIGKAVLLVSEPVQGPSGPTTGIRIRPAAVGAVVPSQTVTAPVLPAVTAAPAVSTLDPAALLAALSPEQLQALLAQHVAKNGGSGSWSE